MLDDPFKYGLLASLAIALLIAAFTDLRSRQIANWLTGAIALAAPLFWWAEGLTLWPEIAIQAALTGHLVLSTLHTNSAASAITRLLDMGVADYLLTSTINGIAAQRLVRVLCPACREAYEPLPEFFEQIGLTRNGPATLYRPRGCRECHGTGYRGRTTIFELMPLTANIRKLVLAHAEAEDLQAASIKDGMRTMFADGLSKALAGVTAVEEVLSATRMV